MTLSRAFGIMVGYICLPINLAICFPGEKVFMASELASLEVLPESRFEHFIPIVNRAIRNGDPQLLIQLLEKLPSPYLSAPKLTVFEADLPSSQRIKNAETERDSNSPDNGSLNLQKLEGILDRELFTDHGRKKTLSPYGRSIYESHCPAYRASVRSLQQCVERLKKDENIAIRVGGHREVLKQFDWAQWHAHKSLELRFLSTAQSLHDLENGKLDLAIVTTKSKLDHIIHKRTKKIDYSWVLSSKLKKRANSFKQLFPILAKENIPFVSYYPTGESRDQFLDNFEENLEEKIEINHQWTCPDWSMILEWLIQKECWSIVPNSLLKAFGELQSGPINQKTPRFFYIAYPEHFKKHKGFQNSIKSIARD